MLLLDSYPAEAIEPPRSRAGGRHWETNASAARVNVYQAQFDPAIDYAVLVAYATLQCAGVEWQARPFP